MWRWAVVVLLWLGLCAPAAAETRVASVGEFTLHAEEQGNRLCMTLRRERRYQGERCGPIPRSPHRPLEIFPDVGWNNYAAAVATPVRVAEVEARNGQRTRRRAVAARGFSARFVILPAPPTALFIRYLGGRGRLLGVSAGMAGYITTDDETPLIEGVEAHTEPELAPTPDDPGRLRRLACVTVSNSTGGNAFCDDDAPNGVVVIGECEQPDLAGGIVAPGIAGVRLTLGSGTELTLPAAELPPAYGGRRAVAARLPLGEAIRDAAAVDGAGAVVARMAIGTEPSGWPCVDEEQGGSGGSGLLVPVAPPSGVVTVARAGGKPLLVADQGETLCVALERMRPRLCRAAPYDSGRPRPVRREGVVGGALSADAATVTLERARGRDVSVRTTEGGYDGRWAGKVRFFAAAAGDVTRLVVRNARGRIIGVRRVEPEMRVRRTVLEDRALQVVRRTGVGPCLTALVPAPCFGAVVGQAIDGPYHPYRGAVVVTCSPRRAVVYGRAPDELAPPRILLAGGGSVRTRRIPLPREDGWSAILPDAGVRGMRSGDRRVALGLPPASAQCGYVAQRGF